MQEAKVPKSLRFQMYREVELKGKSVTDVCETFNVSRKQYYKWYDRDHGGKRKKK